jgi:hypothetical protein
MRAASLAPTRRINRTAEHSILRPLLPALLLGANVATRLLQARRWVRFWHSVPGLKKGDRARLTGAEVYVLIALPMRLARRR